MELEGEVDGTERMENDQSYIPLREKEENVSDQPEVVEVAGVGVGDEAEAPAGGGVDGAVRVITQ